MTGWEAGLQAAGLTLALAGATYAVVTAAKETRHKWRQDGKEAGRIQLTKTVTLALALAGVAITVVVETRLWEEIIEARRWRELWPSVGGVLGGLGALVLAWIGMAVSAALLTKSSQPGPGANADGPSY